MDVKQKKKIKIFKKQLKLLKNKCNESESFYIVKVPLIKQAQCMLFTMTVFKM